MKRKINIGLLSLFFVLFTLTVDAKDPPTPGPPPPPGLPINGGSIYLLISGIAFGFYVLKNKK